MNPGTTIRIDGKPFEVVSVNGPTPWYVASYTVKAHRTSLLGLTKDGVWRYGRGGRVVQVSQT